MDLQFPSVSLTQYSRQIKFKQAHSLSQDTGVVSHWHSTAGSIYIYACLCVADRFQAGPQQQPAPGPRILQLRPCIEAYIQYMIDLLICELLNAIMQSDDWSPWFSFCLKYQIRIKYLKCFNLFCKIEKLLPRVYIKKTLAFSSAGIN